VGLIDDDMRAVIGRSGIGYAATVTPDGKPNLSPKGSLAVWDDAHLYFADIASPQTIENLRSNPNIEVNFVDVIGRRGYRFKGTAEIHATATPKPPPSPRRRSRRTRRS
jgi:predicted pyridoxine 5'-phosphate oxidase superfamily flavin-nucleotide-binding protein